MMDVSLALGGGGVKGIAHIGVLSCLEKNGFKVRAIAGTSAGSLVGALYAAGITPAEIGDLLKNLDQHRMFGRSATDSASLLGLTGIINVLNDVLGERTFEDLNLPFACTAVDCHTSREMFLTKGKVINAVIASSSVPGVFSPVVMNGASLIDGSVLNPVPVSLARWLAPGLPVVAVVLNQPAEKWTEMTITTLPIPAGIPTQIIEQITHMRIAQAMKIFIQSVEISSRMLTELRLQVDQPDVIIRPNVEKFSLLQEVDPDELIQIGETETELALPALHTANSLINRISRRLKHSNPPGTLPSR